MRNRGCLSHGTNVAALLAVAFLVGSCGGEGTRPVAGPALECAGCHAPQAAAWENFSSHKGIFRTCTFCHEEASPSPGEGHRTSAWCDQCHSEAGHSPDPVQALQHPEGIQFITCTTCHNAMGSANRSLIREEILVEPGERVPVTFRSIEGRAEDSYAEPGTDVGGTDGRRPGSGLCEICHTGTAYYTRDGSGEGHYTTRCTACHDHAAGFQVASECRACHTRAVNGFFGSLHGTRQGMKTWYSAENGGFESLTGVAYDALQCAGCHRPEDSTWAGARCTDCHEKNNPEVSDDTCLKCHSRQAAEINQHHLTDVHRDAGMTCKDCHLSGDLHGNGEKHDSMLEPGAVGAACRDCHKIVSGNTYHRLHKDTVDCSACHTQTVLACYNCHFDSEVQGKGKIAYGQFKNWKFLMNRNGKVVPGTVQTLKYGSLAQGTDKTFAAIAPYYSHSVTKKAVDCDDCHDSAAIQEYDRTGRIRAVQWNPDTAKLEHAEGILPVPPDYADSLRFDFVDWDGVSRNPQGNPVWTFLRSGADRVQMIYAYGTPLTREQMEKLGAGKTSLRETPDL
jgi:hypothetical protein